MSILIVDDSRDDRVLLESILQHRGYGDLFLADSSFQAFEFLSENDRRERSVGINLILLDVRMPEMDGLETLRRIKDNPVWRDIPVIMVSGEDDLKNLELAFAVGAMDYVMKPVKKIELIARISSALRLKREIDKRKRHEEDLENKNCELEKALNEIKVLRGFIPICASCKKIRDDKGYWEQVESYIQKRSEAQFTHGVCPECIAKLYPEVKRKSA